MPDTKKMRRKQKEIFFVMQSFQNQSYFSNFTKHCLYDLHDDSNCTFSLNMNKSELFIIITLIIKGISSSGEMTQIFYCSRYSCFKFRVHGSSQQINSDMPRQNLLLRRLIYEYMHTIRTALSFFSCADILNISHINICTYFYRLASSRNFTVTDRKLPLMVRDLM